MANVDSAFGLRPVMYLNGTPYNGQCRKYHIASGYGTALFIGDPVTLAGTSTKTGADFTPAGVYPDIEIATLADGNLFVGVVTSFEPTRTDLSAVHSAASTEGYAYVADDPNIIFEVQMDSATTLTAADIGLNGIIVTGTGSTVTFISGMEGDESSFDNGDASNQWMLMGIVNRADNELAQHVKALVIPSYHQYNTGGRLGT